VNGGQQTAQHLATVLDTTDKRKSVDVGRKKTKHGIDAWPQ
jgi:hypothetical protein